MISPLPHQFSVQILFLVRAPESRMRLIPGSRAGFLKRNLRNFPSATNVGTKKKKSQFTSHVITEILLFFFSQTGKNTCPSSFVLGFFFILLHKNVCFPSSACLGFSSGVQQVSSLSCCFFLSPLMWFPHPVAKKC